MTNWYHAGCIFDAQSRQRADTKKIASASDLGGFADIKDEDKKKVEEFIAGKNLPVFKNKPKKKKKADSEDDDGGSDSDDQPKKKAKAAPKKKVRALACGCVQLRASVRACVCCVDGTRS